METAMARTAKEREQGERFREKIQEKFPARGRFGLLEAESGVSASKWKNFFYRSQEATSEMLNFWFKNFPNDKDWILSGARITNSGECPFGAQLPKSWEGQTIGDRLNWVITEWASPTGDSLFKYLEQKSENKIAAEAWAKVVMRVSEPTPEMIQVVCSSRPHFTRWVVLGNQSFGREPSVDPTDQLSIAAWQKWHEAEFKTFSATFEDGVKE
jgi:hypothetical protein